MRRKLVAVMIMFLIGLGSTLSFAQESYKLEQKTKKTLIAGVDEIVASFEKRKKEKGKIFAKKVTSGFITYRYLGVRDGKTYFSRFENYIAMIDTGEKANAQQNMPKGRQAGDVYVAANPLEFLAAAMNNNKTIKKPILLDSNEKLVELDLSQGLNYINSSGYKILVLKNSEQNVTYKIIKLKKKKR